jgi:hypothetical protein
MINWVVSPKSGQVGYGIKGMMGLIRKRFATIITTVVGRALVFGHINCDRRSTNRSSSSMSSRSRVKASINYLNNHFHLLLHFQHKLFLFTLMHRRRNGGSSRRRRRKKSSSRLLRHPRDLLRL